MKKLFARIGFRLPFQSRRDGLPLLFLLPLFLYLYVRCGTVYTNDSLFYVNGSVRVSPLYPVLIRLMVLLFGGGAMSALTAVQVILALYAVFSLTAAVSERCGLPGPAACAVSVITAGLTYLLRLVLSGPETVYCCTVLSEGLSYPLYFLMFRYLLLALTEREPRRLIPAGGILLFPEPCPRAADQYGGGCMRGGGHPAA